MATNYTLKYRTFQSLIDECSLDFRKYQDSGLIEPQELIKVARKCNYELGLRIYKTKEVVIDINRGRAKLPNDFYVMNFALALGHGEYIAELPQGINVEEVVDDKHVVPIHKEVPKTPRKCEDRICVPCSCHLDCKGNTFHLEQTIKHQKYVWDEFFPLNIITDTEDFNGFCPGKYWQSPNSATIKDGWLYTSIENGKAYINYQGDMEDEDGNLLVPDHEILNEFYENAIKLQILKNVLYNDEDNNVVNKIQLMQQDYKASRNNAMSFVNTPNFNELKELFQATRNAWYNRFYSMFSSNPNFKRL